MKTYEFLEKLANEVHYSSSLIDSVTQQPSDMQKAMSSSNPFLIHNQYKDVGYLANALSSIAK